MSSQLLTLINFHLRHLKDYLSFYEENFFDCESNDKVKNYSIELNHHKCVQSLCSEIHVILEGDYRRFQPNSIEGNCQKSNHNTNIRKKKIRVGFNKELVCPTGNL